jgi:hypothetical protein
MPGAGVPVGDWVTMLDYPRELVEGLDMSVRYLNRAGKEQK